LLSRKTLLLAVDEVPEKARVFVAPDGVKASVVSASLDDANPSIAREDRDGSEARYLMFVVVDNC